MGVPYVLQRARTLARGMSWPFARHYWQPVDFSARLEEVNAPAYLMAGMISSWVGN